MPEPITPIESECPNTLFANLIECVVNDLRAGIGKPNSYGGSILQSINPEIAKAAIIETGCNALRELKAGEKPEDVLATRITLLMPSIIGMLQRLLDRVIAGERPAPQPVMAPLLLALASVEMTTQMICGHARETKAGIRKSAEMN